MRTVKTSVDDYFTLWQYVKILGIFSRTTLMIFIKQSSRSIMGKISLCKTREKNDKNTHTCNTVNLVQQCCWKKKIIALSILNYQHFNIN